MSQEPPSTPPKPKSNTRFIAASIILSIVGILSPFPFLIVVGTILAGIAVGRNQRSKAAWIALALGIALIIVEGYVTRRSI